MTLKEKITELENLCETFRNQAPEITSVWFIIKDVPVIELQEREKELGWDCDIVQDGSKDVLRLQVSRKSGCTIFAYSVPVKKIKPEYLVEA